ncbi:MAG: hypothetical protein ACREV3_01045 [Gammaproteobacteria bacterium]
MGCQTREMALENRGRSGRSSLQGAKRWDVLASCAGASQEGLSAQED